MHERGQFRLDFPSCSPWKQHIIKSRSSHRRCSLIVKKIVLKNFTKFTGKHLCLSLFFCRPRPVTLLKKPCWHTTSFQRQQEVVRHSATSYQRSNDVLYLRQEALAQGFSCEFCNIFQNTFFTEHLWANTCARGFLLYLEGIEKRNIG